MLNEVNYTFAVQKGTFESDITLKKFPYASYKEYTTFDETLEAVHLGEADATVIASSLHKKIEKKYPDLKVTYIVHSLTDARMGVSKNRQDLLEKLNSFIADNKNKEIFEDMYHRWIYNGDETMPKISEVKNPTETVVFAVEKDYSPMSYKDKSNNNVGYLVEFIKRFAVYAKIKAEIKDFYFDDIPEQIKSGNVQVWGSNLQITPERKEYINFTKHFVEENLSVVIKKNRYIEENDVTVFHNLPVGTLPGDAPILEAEVPLAKEVLYPGNDELFSALERRDIVGANFAFPVALPIIRKHPEYVIYSAKLGENTYSIALSPIHQDLRDQMNQLQEQYIYNGVYKKAHHTWFGVDEGLKKLPQFPDGKQKLVIGFIPNAAIARLMKPYFKTFNVIIVHRDFLDNIIQNKKKNKFFKNLFSL